MKRIVMFEGGVETLAYFSRQMAAEFERMGYLVCFYDLKDEKQSARRLRKFVRTGETVLVTFNFQGLEQEVGVYRESTGYIWDEYRIPCYNIVADHPYFYYDRLSDLPRDYCHISIDRFHEQYFRKFYPEYVDGGFLPLAGTQLKDIKEHTAHEEYDVILTGNYTKLSFFDQYINWINEEYAAFYRGIIDELIQNPGRTIEEVELRHLARELGEQPNEALREVLYNMMFIDLYVRNYWRGAVVRTLVNAGICVHVVGEGWAELEDVSLPQNLIVHSQTDSHTCLQMIRHSKISLNVMPWFKDGAHDRVFNSILNGAVCVSDTSRYLCEELSEGEGVCYYELAGLMKLPDMVKGLLSDEARRKEIVSRGKEKVSAGHTWSERAKTLAGWFEKKPLQTGEERVK